MTDRQPPERISILFSPGSKPCAYIGRGAFMVVKEGEAAAEYVRANQWVPVSERLPDNSGWVFVYTKRDERHVAFPTLDKIIGNEWVVGGHQLIALPPGEVTHWQPLPPAPESSE